jgi:ubiquitin-conjugating enzyme E2 D/E
MATAKRLVGEKRQLTLNPIPGVNISWPDNLITHWVLDIDGPADSYYAGDVFTIDVRFDPPYPRDAPRLVMMTPIVHPNISNEGGVCINILRADYSQDKTIRQIIEGIIYALQHPNAAEKLNVAVGNLMEQSEALFEQAAKKQVSANILARASPA